MITRRREDAERNLRVSFPRRCSKTFMYLLSNDNKRRPAGVMSLDSRVLRDVDADSSRRGKDTVRLSLFQI